jgi:hypothetical protein
VEPFDTPHTSYSYVEDEAVSGRKWKVKKKSLMFTEFIFALQELLDVFWRSKKAI